MDWMLVTKIEQRNRWYREQSNNILAGLAPATQAVVAGLQLALSAEPNIGRAALVLAIAHRVSGGDSSDAIVADLLSAGVLPDCSSEELLSQLVVPIAHHFLTWSFPILAAWNVTDAYVDLLEKYLLSRRPDLIDEQLAREVRDLWRFPADALKNGLSQRDPDLELFSFAAYAPASETSELFSLLSKDASLREIERRLALHPLDLSRRDYLIPIARFVETLRFAQEQAHLSPLSATSTKILREAIASTKAEVLQFSSLELRLISPGSEEMILAERCLTEKRSVTFYDDLGPNALPDFRNSIPLLPNWIEDMVLRGGGRFFRASRGPVPYLFITLDGSSSTPLHKVGWGKPRRDGDILLLPLHIDDEHGGFCASFFYRLTYAESLYDLLLLATTGRARLDFAQLTSKSLLTLIATGYVPIPDSLQAELRTIVLEAIRSEFHGDPEALFLGIYQTLTTAHPDAGFLMSENARSEQLLLDMQTLLDGGTTELTTALQTFLSIEQKLADTDPFARNLRGELDSSVEARFNLGRIREKDRAATWGHPAESTPMESELASLTKHLATPSRCILHVSIKDGRLRGYWARWDGNNAEAGEIQFPLCDIDELYRHARAWVDTAAPRRRLSMFDTMSSTLGKVIGRPIVNQLVSLGIKHLILSPSQFLEGLPLHCAPVDSHVALCDLFERVTYTPSARLLQRVIEAGQRRGSGSVAASYSGLSQELDQVRREAAVAGQLLGNATIIDGEDATPESMLEASRGKAFIHIACHGILSPRSYYSSYLQLSPRSGSGRLSVAQILREGDFRSAQLVNIAACDSGQSFSSPMAVQNYTGIDGAFIARGARSTLSSLWPVRDEASLFFMASFYSAISGGLSVDMAYKRAADMLRNKAYLGHVDPAIEVALTTASPDWRTQLVNCDYDLSHPFFWGAFKCSGWTWND